MTDYCHLHVNMLPNLPTTSSLSQCIWFDNEILICGGKNNNNCYSYHLLKQEYKLICAYPKETKLNSHIVVSCAPKNSAKDSITLLSFGGSVSLKIKHHTLIMNYKSVWKDDTAPAELHKNQWIPLPDHNVFGEQEMHEFNGARVCVGGKNMHLLFISRCPNKIDVIDMETFRYLHDVKNNTLPIPQDIQTLQHCFVGVAPNRFLLICEDTNVMITFHEKDNEFVYEFLPGCLLLRRCWGYAFAYLNNQIYFFGGYDYKKKKRMRFIHIYDVGLGKFFQVNQQMPFPISRSAAVPLVGSRPCSIHVFGGANDENKDLNTHFLFTQVVYFFSSFF
ncbi:hypothetical protein RFI_20347 [Reticulomyxa filosa]|uniref:Kelch motif family protein n=1 Tax=Reticulomyxa filosa TaxID=46433 RepID=X6MV68_RETFI|nr:hypothetical protein RFI_20347 [Reticulomyxa filosa]|eukprot:ETO16990.1 hypothetical protein RFI_20347 [Reticulomyxa filosa]